MIPCSEGHAELQGAAHSHLGKSLISMVYVFLLLVIYIVYIIHIHSICMDNPVIYTVYTWNILIIYMVYDNHMSVLYELVYICLC